MTEMFSLFGFYVLFLKQFLHSWLNTPSTERDLALEWASWYLANSFFFSSHKQPCTQTLTESDLPAHWTRPVYRQSCSKIWSRTGRWIFLYSNTHKNTHIHTQSKWLCCTVYNVTGNQYVISNTQENWKGREAFRWQLRLITQSMCVNLYRLLHSNMTLPWHCYFLDETLIEF